ncbi:unnamed protein product [Sphagnum tenellum]
MSVASVVPVIVLPSSSSSSSSSSCSSSSLEIACVSSIGLRIGAQASRVSVKCESVGSSRALAVCGLGKSNLREWREGSGGGGGGGGGGRRRPRGQRRRSGLFGMEDGGGVVVRCDGISGGERGEMMAERNAHHDVAVLEGLGAFSKEGYELTPALIVEEDRESTHTDSPVLNRLKEGFVRFKEEKFLKESELFSRLANGQQPKVMVIGCCDSRVDPTMLMELEPGEVFTLRNVANLVPPWEKEGTYHGTSAALEFAVMGLQVEHIIVLGHRHCGGIRALMTRSDFNSDFIGSWMKIGMSARERTLKLMAGKPITDQCRFCEQESINTSLANLLTFSWIEDRVKQGKLRLHGWYYDFVDGSMISWEVKRQQFGSPTHSSPPLMSTTGFN